MEHGSRAFARNNSAQSENEEGSARSSATFQRKLQLTVPPILNHGSGGGLIQNKGGGQALLKKVKAGQDGMNWRDVPDRDVPSEQFWDPGRLTVGFRFLSEILL